MTGLAFLDRPIRVKDSLKPFSPPRTKNPPFHPRSTAQKNYSISNWEMCALGRFARNWRGRRRQGPGCHLAGEVVTVKGRGGCHLAGEVDTACHLTSLESPASLAKGPNEKHIELKKCSNPIFSWDAINWLFLFWEIFVDFKRLDLSFEHFPDVKKVWSQIWGWFRLTTFPTKFFGGKSQKPQLCLQFDWLVGFTFSPNSS